MLLMKLALTNLLLMNGSSLCRCVAVSLLKIHHSVKKRKEKGETPHGLNIPNVMISSDYPIRILNVRLNFAQDLINVPASLFLVPCPFQQSIFQ